MTPSTRPAPGFWWLPGLAAGVAGLLAFRKISGFDTWWHLAAGRWIVANGAVPTVDPFSHTAAGRDWIDLQWLFDLLIFALHDIGGTWLLVTFSAALAVGSALLAWNNSGPSRAPATATLVLLWAVVTAHERFAVRPEMLTYLWLGLLLLALRRARVRDGRGWWVVPLLVVIWANTHALFVVGLFVVVCAGATAWLAETPWVPGGWREGCRWSRAGRRRLAFASALSFVAPFLNPYGVRGALFPFELWTRIDDSGGAFASIGEFQRPLASFLPDLAVGSYQIFLVFGVVTLATAAWRGRRSGSFDLFGAAVFAGMAFLSTLAWRNVGLLVFGGTPFVIAALGPGVDGRSVRPRPAVTVAALVAIALVAVGVVTHGFYRFARQGEELGGGVIHSSVPRQAVAFARDVGLPPRLFNDMTLGGYFTWEPPVEGGVFIDGRLEVYDADLFTEYRDALADPFAFERVTRRHDVETAMFFHRWREQHRLIRALVDDPGWALIYFDEVAVIFVRTSHQDVIRAALERFPEWARRTEERLSGDGPGGRAPIDLLLGVGAYASLLDTIGYGDAAAPWYEKSIRLGLPRGSELAVRIALAEHYLRRQEPARAREHLRRATELDPGDPRIRGKLAELGGG